ncbi:helix-turn-helix domain-containing protein [Rhodococcus jostii]|uniref:helix-turn-helix domain-containing protein n=1 Tax=Rhodococcus jostii TaxID=132919 RepID=UPI003640548B
MAASDTAESRFGLRVRLERESRKWSQAELAQRVSELGVMMHPTTITKIESRDGDRPRSIRLDEAHALAQVFGTSVDALIGVAPAYDRRAAVEELAATAGLFGKRLARELDDLEKAQGRLELESRLVEPDFGGTRDSATDLDLRVILLTGLSLSLIRALRVALEKSLAMSLVPVLDRSDLIEAWEREFKELPSSVRGAGDDPAP